MNYKVLYRKYRPDCFESLVGQKPIVEILKNSIKENKIAHAYIFSGPRGTGKTSTARIFAKAINCLNNKEGSACNECENCQIFSTSPDIIEIDAASNNGVDEIRELINNVKIMPTSLKYKIYIIDEVHMLSQSAFNALLLTLEEPPEHVIFILATTNLESVPITILSRCQKFDFKRISKKDIVDRLKYICNEENIKYEDSAIEEIAMLADGGLRDALSILDQLSKNTEIINIDIVTKEIGTISNKTIADLITNIDENNIDGIESIIAEFRNVNLNYKVAIKKIIDYLAGQAVEILKYGIKNHLTYDDYKDMVLELNDILNKINISVDPYILIEIILLKYVDNSKNNDEKNKKSVEISDNISVDKSHTEIKKEIINEQKNIDEVKNEKTLQTNEVVKSHSDIKINIDVRINNCFVNATKNKLLDAKEKWDKFITGDLGHYKGLLTDTLPVTASDDYIIIETKIKHQDSELNTEISSIEEMFNKNNEKKYKIVFVSEEKWSLEKQKYIENLKSGYKYQLKDDNIADVQETNIEINNKDKQNIEKIANDIFEINKIEVE